MTLRTSLLALALLLATATRVVAAPELGDQVIYHVNELEDRTAVVTGIVSGTTVDLVAFSDGDDYGDGNPGSQPAAIYRNVTPGVSSQQYSTGTSVSDLVASLGYLQPPSGVSSSGLTLGGSGVQLSALRPVLLTVRGTASVSATQSFAIELRCDSGTTPTAVVDDATGSLGVTLGLAAVMPWKLVGMVHAGDYCRVVQASGAGTVAITGANAQAL